MRRAPPAPAALRLPSALGVAELERLSSLLAASGLAHDPAGPACCLVEGALSALARSPLFAADPLLAFARREHGLPGGWELRLASALLGAGPLSAAAPVIAELPLDSVSSLRVAAARVEELALAQGGSPAAAALAADVAHELGANALLDAPADAEGNPRYAHHRVEAAVVAPEDAARLFLGLDARTEPPLTLSERSESKGRLFICAIDRFGRLRRESIGAALRRMGGRVRLDPAGGGAGLGLVRVIEHSDLVAARVIPGVRTEVLAAVDLGPRRRRAAGPKTLLLGGLLR